MSTCRLLPALCALLVAAGCGNHDNPGTPPAGTVSTAVALVTDLERVAYAGQSVTLHALAAQASGDVSYQWEQIGGAKVALAGADTASLSFVAPALTGNTHELLSFKLSVTDANGTGTPTKVAVTVEPADNVIVKALTKDATALAGQPVSLHALGSGASSPAYQWTQVAPASPTVALTGAGTANPSFTAPDVDGLRFVFQVRYANAVSGRYSTAKTAVLVRRAPTQVTTDPLQIAGSNAVPPQVLSLQAPEDATAIGGTGVDVALAAAGGSPPYAWAWTQDGGTPAALSGTGQAVLRVVTPTVATAEALSFRARVTDANGQTREGVARVRVLPVPATTPIPTVPTVAMPSLAVKSGATVTTTTTLLNPTVMQTGGSVAVVTTATSGTGTTTVAITPPAITTSTEQAELTITGTDAGSGQTVQQIVPILVMQTPNQAPPTVAPPVVNPVLAPNFLPLKVRNCGTPVSVDEGQYGVPLRACAEGGSGTYTYAWTLFAPRSMIGALPIRDAASSQASFDAPAVPTNRSGSTPYFFLATVSDGQQTASTTIAIKVLDTAASLNPGTAADLTVDSGHLVALPLPQPQGGVPPYAWSIAQAGGPPVGAVSGTQPVFPAPRLAPGAADATLAFVLTVTDGFGNSAATRQNVIVKAPAVLDVALAGPSSGLAGWPLSLHANVRGGVAPYTYAYAVSGASLNIPARANPSLVLPPLNAGDPDLNLTIVLTVSDSSSPPQTVASQPLALTVAAPAAPGSASQAVVEARAQALVQSAEAALTAAEAAGDTAGVRALIAALTSGLTISEYAALPRQRQASVAASPAAREFGTSCASAGFPLAFDVPCEDTHGPTCAQDFAGLQGDCRVARVCARSAGVCSWVTPEIKTQIDRATSWLYQYQKDHPGTP